VPVTDTVVHTAADTVMSTRSQAVDIQPSAQNRLRHLAVTAIRVGAHSQSHTVVVRTTAFDEYLSQPSAHIAVDTVSSTRTLRRTVLAVGAVFSTQPMTNSHGHTAFDGWNTLGRSRTGAIHLDHNSDTGPAYPDRDRRAVSSAETRPWAVMHTWTRSART
jgi:hypothetical protein